MYAATDNKHGSPSHHPEPVIPEGSCSQTVRCFHLLLRDWLCLRPFCIGATSPHHCYSLSRLLLLFLKTNFFEKHFMAVPSTYGSSRARDCIQATAAASPEPSTQCARLGTEPAPPQQSEPLQSDSQPSAPQQELPRTLLTFRGVSPARVSTNASS